MGRKKNDDNGQSMAVAQTPEEKQAVRRDRFLRIAPKRMSNALKALNNVSRCANPASYEYTADEVEAMLDALASAQDKIIDAFARTNGPSTTFTF